MTTATPAKLSVDQYTAVIRVGDYGDQGVRIAWSHTWSPPVGSNIYTDRGSSVTNTNLFLDFNVKLHSIGNQSVQVEATPISTGITEYFNVTFDNYQRRGMTDVNGDGWYEGWGLIPAVPEVTDPTPTDPTPTDPTPTPGTGDYTALVAVMTRVATALEEIASMTQLNRAIVLTTLAKNGEIKEVTREMKSPTSLPG